MSKNTIKGMQINTRIREMYNLDNIWQIDDSAEYDCYRKEIEETKNAVGQRKGERILEIGAGRGRVLINFTNNYEAVIAIDLSEKMLVSIKEKCKRLNITNVYLVQGEAERLPFKLGAFDSVIAPGVVGHCSGINNLLTEINRVMKNNAHGIISTGANYLSVPGFVMQVKSCYDCFLKNGFKRFLVNIRIYLESPRKFWLYEQGYCRDTYFSIRRNLLISRFKIGKVSGAGLLPTRLGLKLKSLEKLSSIFPFKYFCRVIIVAFKK